jgi:hypothetical protein
LQDLLQENTQVPNPQVEIGHDQVWELLNAAQDAQPGDSHDLDDFLLHLHEPEPEVQLDLDTDIMDRHGRPAPSTKAHADSKKHPPLKQQAAAVQAEVQAGLLLTLCISLVVGATSICLFSVFRSSCPFLSPKRKTADDAATIVSDQLSAFDGAKFGWMNALWRLPDLSDELFHAIGIDTMLFLYFTRQLIVLTSLIFVVTWGIAVPVYLTGGEGEIGFAAISIANVKPASVQLLVPTVLVYIVSILVLFTVDKCYKTYVSLSQRHLQQSRFVENFSVLIRNVPAQITNSQQLAQWFHELYPDSVLAAHLGMYDTSIIKLKKQLDVLLDELDRVNAKFLVSHVRPITKQTDSETGQSVELDLIDVLQSACLAKEKELITRRQQLLHFTSELPPENKEELATRQTFSDLHTNVGFVTFRRMQTAHVVALQQIDSRPGMCHARLAPEPMAVMWEWLTVKPGRQLWRRCWISLLCAALFVALCIPFGLLADTSVSSSSNSPYSSAFTSEFGALLVLFALLRVTFPLLRELAHREAHHTVDSLLKSLQWKHFYLSLMTMLALCILPQLTTPLMEAVVNPPGDSKLALHFIVHQFVHQFIENLSTRALKVCGFLILLGLGAGGCSLFRIADFLLLVFRLRRAQTAATRNDAHQKYRTESFNFAVQYAAHSSVFAISLVLCTIVPLVVPCALIYFVVWYIGDKYNLLMIHSAEVRLGGRLAPIAFDCIFVSLLVYHALMVGVLVLNNSLILSGAALVPPVATIIAWKMMSDKYRRQAGTIPHDLFSQADQQFKDPPKQMLLEQEPVPLPTGVQDLQRGETSQEKISLAPDGQSSGNLNADAANHDGLPFPPGYSYLHPALRE